MTELVERRIERIINGVIPDSPIEGELGAPRPLRERMSYHRTPGISIAVINDFEIEWARGFGVCEAGTSNGVTPATLFQAGSISKPIFALAVMRLVQEERLDLDEDVNQYLTSWQVPASGQWQPRVTLRQLLSHTAGTTVHGFPGYQVSEPRPSLTQVLNGEAPANTDRVQVNILPGLQFRYSGGGTSIAQQVLIDQMKSPFPEIMRALVLDPLGMADSTYEQPLPAERAASAATAHPGNNIPLVGKFHVYPEMAAAGLWTTPADLARAGVELMRILHGTDTPIFLAQETLRSMLQPQLPDQRVGEDEYCGLGFFCGGKGKGFYFGHAGDDEGFVANMHCYREIGKGTVVMMNPNGYPLLYEVLRAVAREYEWPEFLPKPKTVRSDVRTEQYAGLYSTPEGMTFTVVSREGGLALQYAQQSPIPLYASSDPEFFAPGLNTNVTFEKDEFGSVTALTVAQEGKEVAASRESNTLE
jgi:CubicO group peptidase (beta-lactamase class C family)